MKKLLLSFLFLSAVSQAQVVDIPDANFKADLINKGIDLNSDGDIQVSEAEAVTSLGMVDLNISSLEGIQSFVNLTSLTCYNLNLTALDVSGLTHLGELNCGHNAAMTSLNLSGCTSLANCRASNCALTSLDTSGLIHLYNFDVSNNQLTSLNLAGWVSSDGGYLLARYNQLTSVDASDMGNLIMLDFSHNALTTLDVTGTNVSTDIALSYNHLTSLDLSNSPIQGVDASHNNLASISLNPNTQYNHLRLDNNQLVNLDVSGLYVRDLNANHNNLTSINFQGTRIYTVYLNGNNFQTVDLSGAIRISSFCSIDIDSNPYLETFFAKNGNSDYLSFIGDFNLEYVCIDESDLIGGSSPPNAVFSPYCIFTPGGNYNTITGNVTFDADNNGCDNTDPDQPYVKLNLTSGNNNHSVFTTPDGNFNYFGQTGMFNVGLAMENASLFTITPPLATIVFGTNNNNVTTQDFCITANGIQNDLETIIVPLSPARPGFDATYKIIYKNKGNQPLSGNIDFTYQDNELDFVNASTAPDAQTAGSLSWNFSNLYPFESRSVEVRLNVNSPQETPSVNIGDQLSFSAQANPVSGDITPNDNTFSFRQTVIGSYDPNDITCLEGEHVNPTEIGKYLHYNINFENTGTAAAENIVVRDMIDLTKFDISTLQLLNASHPVTPRITNDKVEFIFEGINLGASEHGNVTFKIKTKNTLVAGNSVSQKADIYFDYNFPVATNVAMTAFDTLGMESLNPDHNISFYPNPVLSVLHVKSSEVIRKIEVFDLQGRLLQSVSANDFVSLAEVPSGVYLVKAHTQNGFVIQKIIKK
ncbi:DUF7619 domain-containing protein [Flavobacterium pallidum]|uniref:Uncharacterized protein n=1 Tax=Flavobacterium pallidum TaxID=2172098 RepID=A0A2S1SDL7_9FLAO|nr:T9SS type A sorting domain-containing protein [Flavobacterium pallidum]AWI24485.1 hypothetical protein HYN49_00475 [Flavobacterium pallidum]